MIMIIVVWQKHFCVCQGSGGSGNDFGTEEVPAAVAVAVAVAVAATATALFIIFSILWSCAVRQTAQKSAAKIQMNSKLLKRQPCAVGGIGGVRDCSGNSCFRYNNF